MKGAVELEVALKIVLQEVTWWNLKCYEHWNKCITAEGQYFENNYI
jgi:hypothetical protein